MDKENYNINELNDMKKQLFRRGKIGYFKGYKKEYKFYYLEDENRLF